MMLVSGKPRALSNADIARLPRFMARPRAVLFDTDTALLYVFDSTGGREASKVVVRADFAAAGEWI